MSDSAPFTDPDEIAAMEAEHLALWRAFLRHFAHLLVPGLRLLDFGCNRGGLLFLLCDESAPGPAPARPGLGIGVDVRAMSAHLAEATRRNQGRYPLLFTTAGPESFPGQFDLAISHEVVYLLPDLPAAFAGIFAALKSGGSFCFTTGCHLENPLWPRWKSSFRTLGITAHEHGVEEYESALAGAGFHRIQRDRLLLSQAEYDEWVRTRESAVPNPAWFPSASAEESYYTCTGKMVLTARKD